MLDVAESWHSTLNTPFPQCNSLLVLCCWDDFFQRELDWQHIFWLKFHLNFVDKRWLDTNSHQTYWFTSVTFLITNILQLCTALCWLHTFARQSMCSNIKMFWIKGVVQGCRESEYRNINQLTVFMCVMNLFLIYIFVLRTAARPEVKSGVLHLFSMRLFFQHILNKLKLRSM